MKTYTQTDIDNQPIDAQGCKRFPSDCSVNDDGHGVLYADRFHTPESLAAYGSSKRTMYEQANGEWIK